MRTVKAFVQYVIRNSGSPQFLINGGKPLAPNSAQMLLVDEATKVLRFTGDIWKNGVRQTATQLTLTAAKYRSSATHIAFDNNRNVITLDTIEFDRGRGEATRTIDEENPTVVALMSFFSVEETPAETPAIENVEETPAETPAKAKRN